MTAARAIGEGRQDELVRVRPRKSTYIEPADGLGEGLGRVNLDGTFEKLFKAPEEARASQFSAQTGREALVPLEDACRGLGAGDTATEREVDMPS